MTTTRWAELTRHADAVLVDALPPGLAQAVREAIDCGDDVVTVVNTAKDAGASPLVLLAVEALAVRLAEGQGGALPEGWPP